jgi:hypothetical protein
MTVELAGLYGLNGDQMKALLDKYGLRAISAHIGVDAAIKGENFDDYKKIGIKYAVVPMTPRPTEENRNEILGGLVEAVGNIKKRDLCRDITIILTNLKYHSAESVGTTR